jgi:NAD(P)-dependent dehydrogenase (short-subunit alcohol dehydrogenase family)
MGHPFDPAGCTALVTGANQGIGRGFVEVLLERGARRVYATARRPGTLSEIVALAPERIVPLPLEVTDDAARRAAAAAAGDVTLLVNNAGIPGSRDAAERRFLAARSLDDARLVMETDCWAPLELCRLFAPAILRNGGGAICNILSIGALFCLPEYSSYSLAKAAFAVGTAGVRAELARQRVLVSGVFTAGVTTRMTPAGKTDGITPVAHARDVLDAMARGEEDIFAGTGAEAMREQIRRDPKAFERQVVERFHTAPLGIA